VHFNDAMVGLANPPLHLVQLGLEAECLTGNPLPGQLSIAGTGRGVIEDVERGASRGHEHRRSQGAHGFSGQHFGLPPSPVGQPDRDIDGHDRERTVRVGHLDQLVDRVRHVAPQLSPVSARPTQPALQASTPSTRSLSTQA